MGDSGKCWGCPTPSHAAQFKVGMSILSFDTFPFSRALCSPSSLCGQPQRGAQGGHRALTAGPALGEQEGSGSHPTPALAEGLRREQHRAAGRGRALQCCGPGLLPPPQATPPQAATKSSVSKVTRGSHSWERQSWNGMRCSLLAPCSSCLRVMLSFSQAAWHQRDAWLGQKGLSYLLSSPPSHPLPASSSEPREKLKGETRPCFPPESWGGSWTLHYRPPGLGATLG